MPIEIKVTKELGNFEPKVFGPFTTRQAIIFGVCGTAAVLMYKAAGAFLPKSMQWYACFPAGVAALVFNKPFYGMRFEQFLKAIFVNVFLAPTNRRYRTENTMEARVNQANKAYDEAQEKALKAEAGEEDTSVKKLLSIPKKQNASSGTNSPKKAKKETNTKAKTKKGAFTKSSNSHAPKNKNYKMSSKAIR